MLVCEVTQGQAGMCQGLACGQGASHYTLLHYTTPGQWWPGASGNPEPSAQVSELIAYFDAVEFVKHSDDMMAVSLILEEKNLYIEHIPTTALASKDVRNLW